MGWIILKVGDLVRIKKSHYAPFYIRPDIGEVGIILEVQHSDVMGTIYFIQTRDGVWRFSDYEVELINNGSGRLSETTGSGSLDNK